MNIFQFESLIHSVFYFIEKHPLRWKDPLDALLLIAEAINDPSQNNYLEERINLLMIKIKEGKKEGSNIVDSVYDECSKKIFGAIADFPRVHSSSRSGLSPELVSRINNYLQSDQDETLEEMLASDFHDRREVDEDDEH